MHVLPMVILYTDSFSSRISDMLTTLSPDPPYVILNGPNQIPTMPSHQVDLGIGAWHPAHVGLLARQGFGVPVFFSYQSSGEWPVPFLLANVGPISTKRSTKDTPWLLDRTYDLNCSAFLYIHPFQHYQAPYPSCTTKHQVPLLPCRWLALVNSTSLAPAGGNGALAISRAHAEEAGKGYVIIPQSYALWRASPFDAGGFARNWGPRILRGIRNRRSCTLTLGMPTVPLSEVIAALDARQGKLDELWAEARVGAVISRVVERLGFRIWGSDLGPCVKKDFGS